jgi:hypothetical protein
MTRGKGRNLTQRRDNYISMEYDAFEDKYGAPYHVYRNKNMRWNVFKGSKEHAEKVYKTFIDIGYLPNPSHNIMYKQGAGRKLR